MAEQGFVTLSIDLAFWGGSEGEPRNGVSPDLYAESFSAAVDYLGLQSFVDRERIGGIGICGSGSYIISAAKIDPRIKAVATASMYDMGAASRNGLEKAQTLEQRKEIIAQAAAQRWVEAAGGERQYTSGVVHELADDTPAVQVEFYDYYRTLMNFYPFNDIDAISPRPLLFVSGDQAHSREFSIDAYERAAEPKELVWVPGAGHVDLYDRTELIPFAMFTDFFKTSLVAGASNVTAREY
ncbi:Uncharacterized protein Cob_v009168 [Colletotrichum orbiculare MAFF 240422]|uniref:AB hydrolase-1 domain-containing protein n=1 Tax=Colletotrichum orbiculare (strain 104-T / ATCC 96160 / CBS 514.97 / LARS 414 / MAFF 240422) TaxID=1213857 RepID=A0A484FHL1_COLOR|nr:Uncharacterized protein Cob_v009168 [Colletotrichum orbiculare MAFF 240422]